MQQIPLIEYLQKRNITDSVYLEFVLSKKKTMAKFKMFSVNNQEYMLSHFFDASDLPGFGLVEINRLLNTENTSLVAIAAVDGDDILCMHVTDNSVWLWCMESDDGAIIPVATSFDNFKKMAIQY